jgi:hypothetical protein
MRREKEDGGLAGVSGGCAGAIISPERARVLCSRLPRAVVQNRLTIAYGTQARISRHIAVAATGGGSQMLTRALCVSRRNPPAHHRRHDPTLLLLTPSR